MVRCLFHLMHYMAWITTFLKTIRQRTFIVLLLAVYGLSAWSLYHLVGYAPQQSWSLPVDYASAVQFSTDNKSVLIRLHDSLTVWDVASGTQRWEKRFEKANVYPQYTSEVLSPDGRLVSYRRCNHHSRELEQCHVIDTYSNEVVLTFRQNDRPWWEHRLMFSSDGQSIVYSDSDQENNSINIWDVPSRKVRYVLPSNRYQLTCIGQHHVHGDIIAGLDEKNRRFEIWKLSNGQLWKTIPMSKQKRQLWRDTIWFTSDGEELYHVGGYSREEQIKSSFCAGSMMCCMFSSMATNSVAAFMQTVEPDLSLYFAFNRASTTETSIDCYDVAKQQIKHSNYLLYPAQDASDRFLLRRTPAIAPATEVRSTSVEVFDVEHGRILAQVPGGMVSHQVDLLSHNAMTESDFQIFISPQSNVTVVQHSSLPQSTRWEEIREWLSQWITALKTDNTDSLRYDRHACFYDSKTSQLVANLKTRSFDCFSPDGLIMATSIHSKNNTIIEVWNWPLRKPWLRILGWPVLVILALLFLQWLLRIRTKRIHDWATKTHPQTRKPT